MPREEEMGLTPATRRLRERDSLHVPERQMRPKTPTQQKESPAPEAAYSLEDLTFSDREKNCRQVVAKNIDKKLAERGWSWTRFANDMARGGDRPASYFISIKGLEARLSPHVLCEIAKRFEIPVEWLLTTRHD